MTEDSAQTALFHDETYKQAVKRRSHTRIKTTSGNVYTLAPDGYVWSEERRSFYRGVEPPQIVEGLLLNPPEVGRSMYIRDDLLRSWVTSPVVSIESATGGETNPKDLVGIKKPRLYLVPPASLIYQALAMRDGAEKYGPYNWREKKVSAMIYVDATLRHLEAWLDGEEDAEDSKMPHLAHAIACLGIIVDAKETGNLVDDRPKPGAAAALIARYTL